MNYADKTENEIAGQNFNRAMSIMEREEGSLESTVKDWAYWDDTFYYLEGSNSKYIDINLQDSTLASLNINYMGFYNINGVEVFEKDYGMDAALASSVKEEFMTTFQKNDYFEKLLLSSTPLTGLLVISGQPFIFSMSPVTTSDMDVPTNGVIVFCKLIDESFTDYLSKILKVNVKLHSTKDSEVLDALKQNDLRLTYGDTVIYIKKTADSISTFALVDNPHYNSSVIMELNSTRPIYRDGLVIIHYSGIAFSVTFLTISVICLLVLEFSVFRRIEKLDRFMNTIRNQKTMEDRISLPGKDEISNLAMSANNMLHELDNYYREIKTNDERFRLIMEATNDGYFDTDLLMNRFKVSTDLLLYLGYENLNGYLDYDQVLNIIHPEDKARFKEALRNCLNSKAERLSIEYRVKNNSGDWLWLLCRGKIVQYDDFNNPRRLIGTITDITQRKDFEEENLYLSQTDMITSLKNRTYIESLMKKADQSLSSNNWIIMGDINGLKLINNTFGHLEGDRLLRDIGVILQKCCTSSAVPARWSGNEFLIFVKDNNAQYVDDLLERINNECANLSGYQTTISLSWGRATKDRLHTDLNSVIKLAEERMYRNKLLESRSAKNSLLSFLGQSLHAKHIETEEHTKRIAQMCGQIGKRMGLSQEELDEVALLSLLHDIGKIGIPEAILMKPDKLTKDEWEIMRTHSEIGYRIAVSTPDLAHVATEILSHHERYDGSGYPQGLTGKAIPKLSRLLAIVDSFDVMTHARHYKQAMSKESAVLEIKNCSGKQFDPEMVEQFLTILHEDEESLIRVNPTTTAGEL